MSDKAIENVLHENRTFEPQAAYQQYTNTSLEEYQQKYRQSIEDPEAFWNEVAQNLHWFDPYQQVLNWQEPFAEWFVGGTTNLAYNALERNLSDKADKKAIIWEGEDGEVRTYTYADLTREVKRFANVLLDLGVQTGDRVTLYLPMIPEAAFAMLACARIGAVHSVVFGGFSSGALADRINDAGSKVLITADGGYRRGSAVPLKRNADDAVQNTPSLEKVLVVKRTGQDVQMQEGRDVWLHDALQNVSDENEAVALDAQHPHFILYTSGSTGKPKGVLHALGGYMVNTYLTTKTVFDLHEDDIYWCTADVGWITGHSYIVYGPLLAGATVLMYEGAPNQPDWGRFWKIIQDHKVTILYTAPTAIRSFMRAGSEFPNSYDLSSLRLLGSVGEPINPEAWIWYYTVIGKEKCPVIDTWWQTETGSIMITTLPGAHTMKPGSAGVPMYGVDVAIVDADGQELGADEGGFLVIRKPWPSMLRTVYGDDNRYKTQYWGEIPHVYFAGDGARRDKDGYFTIVGRIDDVLNVSGHRLGTMEVESALVSHPAVAEAAVVGRPDPIKGEGIVAFVTLQTGAEATEQELKAHVAKEIGAIARPDMIRFAEALPKTRSGKIMRRLLRQIASGQEIKGDTSTLEDVSVIEKLQQSVQQS
ncbi:acetate--CoA ligase [Deinococcus misasensis]|uniref:acetate--CoA ligase n=1 Tax=Deinococcus misasensis TaxID=392413 RepID=UPI00054F0940|nr:acetate--CoA ligase [Deinococcus misasensis]